MVAERTLRWHSALLTTLTVALLSCSDSTPQAVDAGGDAAAGEAGADVEAPPVCTMMPPALERGSENGAANPLTVPPGAARAGRITAQQLPQDRTGLASWQAGDFVLANERVAVLIAGARPTAGYNPWGGEVEGVARNNNGALVDAADFGEPIFGLGRFTVATERVTVLRDGSSGGSAIVRAEGPMRAIPFIDDFGRALAPQDFSMVQAAIDYELAPGADHVEISMTVNNPEASERSVRTVLHAFFQGYRMTRFFPDAGFSRTGSTDAVPNASTVGWVDDNATSWAWQLPEGQLLPFLSVSGFDGFRAPMMTLAACGQTRFRVARVVAGAPGNHGLDGLQESLARLGNRSLRAVRVTVLDGAGMPAPNARVHATSADGMRYLTRATTDMNGVATLHLPAEATRVIGWRQGDPVSEPAMVAMTSDTTMLRLGASGQIRVTARDAANMTGMPVRVQISPMSGAVPSVPSHYGEIVPGNNRVHTVFPQDGDVTVTVPAGAWRVLITRGFEYTLSDTTVTVTAGQTQAVNATLQRVVDTTGVLCGDFHIHTHRSPDSGDSGRLKLASGAADGVEVMARSEHEFVSDFQPLIDEMGLTPWVRGLGSLELTTFVWGHFGVFPLTANPARPNGGNFEWAGRRPTDVFADVRARSENPTLVINHPRGGAAGAYFDAAGYDAMTGQVRNPNLWDDRFTTVEFFNDSSFEERLPREVQDWFSFLSAGRRVWAVGSSDSHGINPNSPVGYPRTCMYLNTDDPRMATPTAIGAAVGAGRTNIFGGIYVNAEAVAAARTAGPGQELTGAGNEARLRVTVQAPPWVTANTLTVWVDARPGTMTATRSITLNESTRDPMNNTIRYRGEINVPVAANGSYVIVAAQGGELVPLFPGKQAFGVTNPIFLRR